MNANQNYCFGVTPTEAHQIANLISGNLKVRIKEGEEWLYQFDEKTIYYRPADLSYLTEIDVVANLLHEAGHAKYSTSPSRLSYKRKVPPAHQKPLKEGVINLIEDFRIEDKLRASYPHAKDYLPLYSFKTAFILQKAKEQFMLGKTPKYLEFCGGLYAHLAGVPNPVIDPEVRERVELTKEWAVKARHTKNTQALTDIVVNKIYPHIKEYLNNFPDRTMEIRVVYSDVETPPYQDLYPTIKNLINPTANRLNRVLTDVKFNKLAGKYRTGKKLNKRRLYRFRLGDDKLFQRRLEPSTKDYAFALVVDESGSMADGNRIREAVRSAILFSYVLDKLKIPFSLHGFNKKIKHYKKPSETFTPKTKKIFGKMFLGAYTGGENNNTNDAWAINQVAKLMMGYKGKRVMMVVSDGNPYPDGEGLKYILPQEIKKAEKMGIEVIGIGIGSEQNVDEYYRLCLDVPTVENLPEAIIAMLKNKLKK